MQSHVSFICENLLAKSIYLNGNGPDGPEFNLVDFWCKNFMPGSSLLNFDMQICSDAK